MENTLTIIKEMQCLPFYPITAIPPDVLKLMQRSFDALATRSKTKAGNLIPVFDAYCHVTATPLTYLSLSNAGFEKVIKAS